ncbi:MAG: sortase [Methanobacterium sp.]
MEILTAQYGFEVIKNNFKVNSVLIPAKTPFWGSVSIPTHHVNWGIRSDTVNGYNSVYYYSESSYPDRNSTMGLLCHRTSFSAPFRNIDQLKPGDEVVINDYLTQRKYIYQVVSNRDIKWGYKTDPIKFPPGEKTILPW